MKVSAGLFLSSIFYLLSSIFLPSPVFANCNNFTVPERIIIGSTFITGGTFPPIRVTGAKSGIRYTLNAYPQPRFGSEPIGISSDDTTGTDLLFETDPIALDSGKTYLLMAEAATDFCTSNNFTVVPVPTQTPTPTPTLISPQGNITMTITTSAVTMGDLARVTISNIPLKPAQYQLLLSPSDGKLDTIKATSDERKLLLRVYPDNRCTALNKPSIWSPVQPGCVLDNAGSSLTFTTDVKTNGLNITDLKTPKQFNISFMASTSTGDVGLANVTFLIKPINYKPSFTLLFADENGTIIGTAEPNQDIVLKLYNIDVIGAYSYGIGINEKGEIMENKTSMLCDKTPECSLDFTVPNDIKVSKILIAVFDPDGKSSTGQLNIVNITGGIGNQVPPTPFPTFPPTPVPPSGPCLTWVGPSGNPVPAPKDPKEAIDKQIKCAEVDTAVGPIQTEPVDFIKKIFSIILSLSGGIALLLIIVSGYRLITSQGNPEKVQAAKETLTSAIVGLLFIIFSIAILEIIGVDILKIPGLN